MILIVNFLSRILGKEQPTGIYAINIKLLNGTPLNLADFKGKKLLIVNVASACGLTVQYEKLQKLYAQYQHKLVVLGVPCNDFAGQEPGSPDEIQKFCSGKYNVTFPLTEKINILKEPVHPLYRFLTSKEENGLTDSVVDWNFQKYLIDENGKLVAWFMPNIQPDDPAIIEAINK